jgi:hypothetical protein
VLLTTSEYLNALIFYFSWQFFNAEFYFNKFFTGILFIFITLDACNFCTGCLADTCVANVSNFYLSRFISS